MKTTKAEVGTVSSGTMLDQDLFDAFTSELEYLDGARHAQFVQDHQRLFNSENYKREDNSVDEVLFDELEEAVNELFDILNEYAPDDCYFGAHPGDGCDYGFWEAEQD